MAPGTVAEKPFMIRVTESPHRGQMVFTARDAPAHVLQGLPKQLARATVEYDLKSQRLLVQLRPEVISLLSPDLKDRVLQAVRIEIENLIRVNLARDLREITFS